MSIFYCFHCNEKINGKIFKGYDKSFCSKICRYNLIKNYNFNYRCELELKTENIIKKPSLRRIKSFIEPIIEPIIESVVEQVLKSEVYPVIDLDIKPDVKPTIEKKVISLNSKSYLSLINLYEHIDGYKNICIDINKIDIPFKNVFVSLYENTLGNLF
tara:strand:+ start:1408 stop:1881 length:474 start_codon:yes stop_codon:yes gene_type:complete